MVRGVFLGALGVLLLPVWAKVISSSSFAANGQTASYIQNSQVDTLDNSEELSPSLPGSVEKRFNAISKAVSQSNPQELLTAIFPQPELETLLSYSPQPQTSQSTPQEERPVKIEQQPTSISNQQLPQFSRDQLFPKTANSSNLKFAHPAPATERVASVFGWRVRPFSRRWQMHNGIDYGAPLGSTVVAAEDGIVTKVVSGCLDFRQRWCGSQYGNWVQVDHGNGVVTTYAHLLNGSINVKEGNRVWQNQTIAKVGSSGWSTGAHLDFRVEIKGHYKDPALYVRNN